MCGDKKKKRKRMIRQMLNWNTDVVLAYNVGRIGEAREFEIRQLGFVPSAKLITKSKIEN